MGFGSLRCWNKFGFACLLRGMLAHPSARLYPQSPPRAMGPASGRTKLTSVRVVSSKWTRGTPSCWTAFGFWWGWSQPGSNLDLGLSSAILQPFSEGLLRELNFGRSTFSSLLLKTLTHSLSNTGRHSGNSKEFAWWKNMRYQASLLLKMESYYTWDRLKCKCRSQYLQSQPWHINSSLFNKHFTKLNIAIAIMPLVKNRTITNFKISNIGTTEPQTQTWNIAVMSQQASAWHRQGGFGAFGSIACLDFWSDQGASSCTTFHISQVPFWQSYLGQCKNSVPCCAANPPLGFGSGKPTGCIAFSCTKCGRERLVCAGLWRERIIFKQELHGTSYCQALHQFSDIPIFHLQGCPLQRLHITLPATTS